MDVYTELLLKFVLKQERDVIQYFSRKTVENGRGGQSLNDVKTKTGLIGNK